MTTQQGFFYPRSVTGQVHIWFDRPQSGWTSHKKAAE